MQDHALHRAKILIYAKGNPTEIWCKLKFTSSVYVSLRCLKQRFPSCFRLSVYVVNELKNGTLFPSHFRRRILVFTLTGMYVYENEIKGFRCRILHINATEIWNFRPWNLSLRSLKLEFQSNFRPVHVGTTTQKWNMFLSINLWPTNKYQIVKLVLQK